jgi:hypothetical protein
MQQLSSVDGDDNVRGIEKGECGLSWREAKRFGTFRSDAGRKRLACTNVEDDLGAHGGGLASADDPTDAIACGGSSALFYL